MVAGLTTLVSLLVAFRMGFRSLAIQKRSGEVWTVLSAVKTTFAKFGGVLKKTGQQWREALALADAEAGCAGRAACREFAAVRNSARTPILSTKKSLLRRFAALVDDDLRQRLDIPSRSSPFRFGEGSVSKTQFFEALSFASRLYGRVSVRHMRSHTAIRMLVAGIALVVRVAQQNKDFADAECRRARIKGNRLEVRITRLIVGRRLKEKQDQIHRWANAAAYVAKPLNGDPPPGSWRDALRYIIRRGGVRLLSDLYAARKPECDWNRYFARQADAHDEWYTPPYIFDCLGCEFDLDPASPGHNVVPWIPATVHYTSDGLEREWFGFVWLNPPYGRSTLFRWVEKFVAHRSGICLVPDRTQSPWSQQLLSAADLILCLSKRVMFAGQNTDPVAGLPFGNHLVGIGDRSVPALIRAHREGLGVLLAPHRVLSVLHGY